MNIVTRSARSFLERCGVNICFFSAVNIRSVLLWTLRILGTSCNGGLFFNMVKIFMFHNRRMLSWPAEKNDH